MNLSRRHTRTNFDRLSVIAALVVFLLAALNFHLGYRLYAVLIILFGLSLLVIHRPNLVLLAIPVLLVLLFSTGAFNSLKNLRETAATLINDPKMVVANLFSPNAGLEVLPREAIQVKSLIEDYRISSYKLTKGILEDQEIMQRVIESTWPVTVTQDSPYLFGFTGELTDHPECRLLERMQDIELGYCP